MNSRKLAQDIILTLDQKTGVSGHEHELIPLLENIFQAENTETSNDFMGNFYAYKKGEANKQTIMLAAHLDEIGLMITHISERGFLHFTAIGGIDARTLLYQEVIVHGVKDIAGVICSIPAENDPDKKKALTISNLVIDIGYDKEMSPKLVKPGDIVSLRRTPFSMQNDRIVSKALDDHAGIAVLAICMKELAKIKHQHSVCAVATVQEEVGLRGAMTSSNRLQPSLAIAIDVTHAQTPDAKSQVAIQLDKGPVIARGPNIHPKIFLELTQIAKEARLGYQIQPIATATGTDARIIQLTGQGIPTALISIPLRYMHTSVEVASLQDIVDCGKLLAAFIANLPEDLEEWLCF